ncbi:EAL domain-containing protein [Paenalkalicoccus suaedae]|uniref:EAL domain-containing protein n=1 Tax=Paenalkalicoccus suaedae TaxID=2592382 RepID=A0A859FF69_9BACI|nr:bifunctional diguanylate cyclase/phosphodiesterase [Paenalkalicoccus suaedae]QKS71819.1 EAL domain-containing protein [Paenalkalicoccus suaedae]
MNRKNTSLEEWLIDQVHNEEISTLYTFLTMLESISSILVINQLDEIVFCSESYATKMQAKPSDLVDYSYMNLLSDDMSMEQIDQVEHFINDNSSEMALAIHSFNSNQITFETKVFPLQLKDISYRIITHHDVSGLMKAQETIEELVKVDVLTGLRNRLQLEHDIESLIKNDNPFAVMYIDLDRFKYYNDTLGHYTGDKLILEISRELQKFENAFTDVYRYGGDEFIILLQKIKLDGAARRLTDRLLSRFKSMFVIAEQELFVTASIGISVFPTHSDTKEMLIQQAEQAMQFAKEQGKNGAQQFKSGLRTKYDEKLKIEKRLRRAVRKKLFTLVYQPQLDLIKQRVIGVEALLRWEDEELGHVSPLTFIPIAEETGLIIHLGDWVLEEACLQAKKWSEEGLELRMGVNISPQQFQRPDFVNKVKQTISKVGLAPRLLDLEITENDLLYNRSECIRTLHRLKEEGICISIDDFGTGYSSLSYLRQFPVDTLKIDKSFIKEVIINKKDQAIVTSIIQLAHNMKMKVVAEGVENIDTLPFLTERHCDEMQGYLYSKPLVAERVKAYLEAKNPQLLLA